MAKAAVPSLGIATAYRAIKDLVESGWLVPVATPAGSRFELADIAHHHHFYCRVCSRTFDIHGCLDNVEKIAPRGFQPDGHDLTITGKCILCTKGKKESSIRI